MTDSSATIITASTNTRTELSAADRRQRWFEVCLVLLVAFGSYIVHAIYLLISGPRTVPQTSAFRWAGGIVQEASSLLLLGYVLSRRCLRYTNIGLRWSIRDVGVGLVLIVASYAAYWLGNTLVQTIHHLMYGTWATGPTGKDFFAHSSVMIIPFSLLNPFFEELIVRAYLMSEVIELTASSALAVVLSVGVQFAYHLYYGWAGAVSLAFPFLILALYYARSRRALPVIVAHGFFDLYGLLWLW